MKTDKTTFTQGNWVARIDDYVVDVIEEKTGFGICQIGTRKQLINADYPNHVADANAKLISAAPDLLKCLKMMLSQFEYDGATEFECQCFWDAKQAIKKAEGHT